MRIAITAPAGNIGSKLVRHLLDRGQHDLVLLARRPERLQEARKHGAKIARGDLTDQDFVNAALRGVDAVFWLIPPNPRAPDLRIYQAEIARIGATAAKTNHVRHVVLLSSFGADQSEGTGPILGLHDAESIFRSAVDHLTILRPVSLMENFLMQVDSIRKDSSIFLPISGQTRAPLIATEDIAKAAADALLGAPPDGTRIITLVGPKSYSFEEAASIIGQAIGRPVRHVHISDEQAREALTSHGVSANVADRMVEMYDGMDHGRLHEEAVPEDAAVMPTSFEQFAQVVIRQAITSG